VLIILAADYSSEDEITALAQRLTADIRLQAPNLQVLRNPKWNRIDEYMIPCLKEADLDVQSDGEPGDDDVAPEPE
jgi:hypothetical protein